jgi:hypothetical protein
MTNLKTAESATVVAAFVVPALVKAETLITRIKAWGKSAHESQIELVALAQQALIHFHTHGDATSASLLVKETPLSMRKQALIAWFKASAPISYSDKTESFTKDKTKGAIPMYSVEPVKALPYIQKAFEKPFYDMFKEPKIELFDESLSKPFKSLIAKYTKAKAEGLVQQAEIIRAFMDKVRILEVEAETIQESIDSVKRDAVLESIKADEEEVVIDSQELKAA